MSRGKKVVQANPPFPPFSPTVQANPLFPPFSPTGSQSMILTITMHAHQLVQSDQCAVYLHEEGKGTLWSVTASTAKDVRIPSDKGIVGASVQGKCIIMVEDVTLDDRYLEAENLIVATGGIDDKPKTMLVVPLLVPREEGLQGKGGERCLGSIVMQNKREFDGEISAFNEEDAEVMETFAK